MQKLPLLLSEPNAVMRQTVALTAGMARAGPVFQAATARVAQELLQQHAFGAVILSLDGASDEADDGGRAAIGLVAMLRAGETLSPPDLGIVVTAAACSRAQMAELKGYGIDRVILKPFKARLLIETLTELSERAARMASP